MKDLERVYNLKFKDIYPCYLTKAEKKSKTQEQVNQIITWLTGYSPGGIKEAIADEHNLKIFFANAPKLNPNRKKITGVICGYRVEDIKEPLMQEIRYLDKLIDELARGKKFENILRS